MSNIFDDLSSWGNTEDKKVLSKVVEKPKRKQSRKKKAVEEKAIVKKNDHVDNLMEYMDSVVDENDSENQSDDIPIDEQIKIEARRKKAEMRLKEEKAIQAAMETAVMRGQLLRRELFYDSFAPFLDRLLGDLKRAANTYLSDIAGEVLENKGLNSAIRMKWEDKVLQIIDEAKKGSMKELKSIEKDQAEK